MGCDVAKHDIAIASLVASAQASPALQDKRPERGVAGLDVLLDPLILLLTELRTRLEREDRDDRPLRSALLERGCGLADRVEQVCAGPRVLDEPIEPAVQHGGGRGGGRELTRPFAEFHERHLGLVILGPDRLREGLHALAQIQHEHLHSGTGVDEQGDLHRRSRLFDSNYLPGDAVLADREVRGREARHRAAVAVQHRHHDLLLTGRPLRKERDAQGESADPECAH